MQHPQQALFAPDPSLPRGQGDLEALERLKETIKNNQHEVYRATPQLDVLARLYKGPLSSLPPSSSHPEQIQIKQPEKAAGAPTPSGGNFEAVSPSARHGGGPRPGIPGSNMVRVPSVSLFSRALSECCCG